MVQFLSTHWPPGGPIGDMCLSSELGVLKIFLWIQSLLRDDRSVLIWDWTVRAGLVCMDWDNGWIHSFLGSYLIQLHLILEIISFDYSECDYDVWFFLGTGPLQLLVLKLRTIGSILNNNFNQKSAGCYRCLESDRATEKRPVYRGKRPTRWKRFIDPLNCWTKLFTW